MIQNELNLKKNIASVHFFFSIQAVVEILAADINDTDDTSSELKTDHEHIFDNLVEPGPVKPGMLVVDIGVQCCLEKCGNSNRVLESVE